MSVQVARRGSIAARLQSHTAGAITQVGTWTSVNTAVVTFDATPVSGQLLVARVAVTRTSAVPACTTPTGWSLRGSIDGINGTSHVKMFWFDRIADGTATDTPTLTVTGGSQRIESGRFTGHAASGYFDIASAGTTDISTGAGVTVTDSALTPGASGLAFAALALRTTSQSITSWSGGFTSSFVDATAAGGGVATQTTTSGVAITASLTVNEGASTPITDLMTFNYKAA